MENEVSRNNNQFNAGNTRLKSDNIYKSPIMHQNSEDIQKPRYNTRNASGPNNSNLTMNTVTEEGLHFQEWAEKYRQ